MNLDFSKLILTHDLKTDFFKYYRNESQIQRFLQRNFGIVLWAPLGGVKILYRWLILKLSMKSRLKFSKTIVREPQEFDNWGLRRA
jgi:hypothetical protein